MAERLVVFLDIDGVLLPFGEGIDAGMEFPERCLSALSHILESTGADIVLSSTWRCDDGAVETILSNFKRFGEKHGGPLEGISSIEQSTSSVDHSHRQWEIKEWLESSAGRGVQAWVALDDEDLLGGLSNETARSAFIGHVVRTQSHLGLTLADAELAVRALQCQQAGDGQHLVLLPQPLLPQRNLSLEYESSGASRYPEEVLMNWQSHALKAATAMRCKDWPGMVQELKESLAVRPDWAKGYLGLHVGLMRLGATDAAEQALSDGLVRCTDSLRQAQLNGNSAPPSLFADTFSIGEKMVEQAGDVKSALPCRVLGVETESKEREVAMLYREAQTQAELVDSAPQPLRLLFLDVDGVLNTMGTRNCGSIEPKLLERLRQILTETGAVVVLSTTWRSYGSLRSLIVGALWHGCVIGQTPAGFSIHARPREIVDFLEQPKVRKLLASPGASWSVVDDMNLIAQAKDLAASDHAVRRLLPEFSQRFVQTDKSVGLEDNHVEQLVRILSATA
eukprot:TRINITY_DN107425_c0_g1_i1.p1 TRINITY_DN107425_c0_g1~~TRINITY_DN107425_c0_g1_i1.p1  ORF type:complete len:508 (+),score=94.15 TRINITY_DN107425_c0_g1_i1:51-1574(+)